MRGAFLSAAFLLLVWMRLVAAHPLWLFGSEGAQVADLQTGKSHSFAYPKGMTIAQQPRYNKQVQPVFVGGNTDSDEQLLVVLLADEQGNQHLMVYDAITGAPVDGDPVHVMYSSELPIYDLVTLPDAHGDVGKHCSLPLAVGAFRSTGGDSLAATFGYLSPLTGVFLSQWTAATRYRGGPSVASPHLLVTCSWARGTYYTYFYASSLHTSPSNPAYNVSITPGSLRSILPLWKYDTTRQRAIGFGNDATSAVYYTFYQIADLNSTSAQTGSLRVEQLSKTSYWQINTENQVQCLSVDLGVAIILSWNDVDSYMDSTTFAIESGGRSSLSQGIPVPSNDVGYVRSCLVR